LKGYPKAGDDTEKLWMVDCALFDASGKIICRPGKRMVQSLCEDAYNRIILDTNVRFKSLWDHEGHCIKHEGSLANT